MAPKKIEEQLSTCHCEVGYTFYDRFRTSTTIKAKKTFCKNLFHRKNSSNIMLLLCNMHVKQAAFQRGHIWGQILCPDTMIPSPDSLGVG